MFSENKASQNGVNLTFEDPALFLWSFWESGICETNYLRQSVFCTLEIIILFGDGKKTEINFHL
jgi:hypothetical protein